MDRFEPKILIVEDNQDFAENLSEMVQDFGFQPILSENGGHARKLIVENRFDLAMIDINLPGAGGLQLLGTLRDLHPACLCIIITGNATMENALEALNRGAFSYLTKGAEAEEFRTAIQNALNLIKSRREVEQLREINQTIIDNFPGKILVLDESGRVIQTNRYPLAIDGLDLETSARSTITDSLDGSDHWAKIFLEHYRLASHSRRPEVIPELLTPRSDGSTRNFRVHLTPLSHAVAHMLVFIEDLTHVTQLKEDLKRSEKLATVGEMASSIAHELRNPLSGISSAVQILRDGKQLDGAGQEICNEIIGLVDRLDTTVKDLLLFAKPMKPNRVTASLRDVIDSHLQLFQDDPRYQDIEIDIDQRTERAYCHVDPFLIRQAFTNIIDNAVQAMGGRGNVRVTIDKDGEEVAVHVLDEGPGFTKDALSLFQPFFTTKPSGTGLGLSITRKILDVHGGSIELRNRADRPGGEVVFKIAAAPIPPGFP